MTSTGTETPDWAALGYPFVANATAPVSATGTLSYTTNQAASVPAASIGSYQGPGNVTLTAIDDDEQTVSANAQQPWFNGGTITTTIQACATYPLWAVGGRQRLPEVLIFDGQLFTLSS